MTVLLILLAVVTCLVGYVLGRIDGYWNRADEAHKLERTAPAAWAWEHFNTATGEVVGTGISTTPVQPTNHAYYADEAGTQWIGTRVTPLRP